MSVRKMSVPTETLQALLNYLSSRPYSEVFTLVEKLRAEAQGIPEEEVARSAPADVVQEDA